MKLKSVGNFLGLSGVLLLLFSGIKYMTFDAIVETDLLIIVPGKSYPFEWVISLGIGLVILGSIVLWTTSSGKLPSRIRAYTNSIWWS